MADISITAIEVATVDPVELRNFPEAETLTVGALVVINSSGKAAKADADSLTDPGTPIGIVVARQSTTVGVLFRGIVNLGSALSGLSIGDKVYASATAGALADADVGELETATITITGSPTGGTFTLTYGGAETGNIAYNASAATIKAALEALATIQPGNVDVTGSGPFTVTFAQELADQNVGALTSDNALLTGGTSPDAVIAVTNAGIASRVVGRVWPGWSSTTPAKLLRLEA